MPAARAGRGPGRVGPGCGGSTRHQRIAATMACHRRGEGQLPVDHENMRTSRSWPHRLLDDLPARPAVMLRLTRARSRRTSADLGTLPSRSTPPVWTPAIGSKGAAIEGSVPAIEGLPRNQRSAPAIEGSPPQWTSGARGRRWRRRNRRFTDPTFWRQDGIDRQYVRTNRNGPEVLVDRQYVRTNTFLPEPPCFRNA